MKVGLLLPTDLGLKIIFPNLSREDLSKSMRQGLHDAISKRLDNWLNDSSFKELKSFIAENKRLHRSLFGLLFSNHPDYPLRDILKNIASTYDSYTRSKSKYPVDPGNTLDQNIFDNFNWLDRFHSSDLMQAYHQANAWKSRFPSLKLYDLYADKNDHYFALIALADLYIKNKSSSSDTNSEGTMPWYSFLDMNISSSAWWHPPDTFIHITHILLQLASINALDNPETGGMIFVILTPIPQERIENDEFNHARKQLYLKEEDTEKRNLLIFLVEYGAITASNLKPVLTTLLASGDIDYESIKRAMNTASMSVAQNADSLFSHPVDRKPRLSGSTGGSTDGESDSSTGPANP
jgi:hypothetical protein